jgi:hypothetical protein
MRQPGTAAAAQAPTLRLLLNVVNFSPFRSATNSMRPTTVLSAPNDGFPPKIGIGGHLAMPPLSHHRAYGSVPRRFDWVKLWQRHGVGEDRVSRNSGCAGLVGPPGVRTCARTPSVNRRRPLHGTLARHDGGAISIAWHTRPVISAAIIVVPEPLNGS